MRIHHFENNYLFKKTTSIGSVMSEFFLILATIGIYQILLHINWINFMYTFFNALTFINWMNLKMNTK